MDCAIWRPDDMTASRIRFCSGCKATSLDVGSQQVAMDNGIVVEYDKLVLATGSRVRHLSVPGAESDGVYTLRTVDDAMQIAKRFRKGMRLLVVGGGFVGLEIAAAARSRGLETVVVEATNRLLSRIVPQEIGAALAHSHEKAGVSFRVGAMVESLVANRSGKLKAALLSDGETVACDLAVIGVGVTANTDLAKTAGLHVQVGIRADSSLRTSAPNVYACGDAASFWHPLFERYVRVEAWHNAEDHARVVAGQLLGHGSICDTVPFFWSDQYDQSLQIVGIPYFGSQLVSHAIGGAKILYHLDARGSIVAATGLGHDSIIGRKIAEARRLIGRRARLDLQMLKVGRVLLEEG
jgi:3-phenylpropionate/trans-cinnamate dioxygenase ferredoxin reductase subunit